MKSEYAKLNALAVRLYGRQIGIITKLAGERQLFSFEQDYIDDPQRQRLEVIRRRCSIKAFPCQGGGLRRPIETVNHAG